MVGMHAWFNVICQFHDRKSFFLAREPGLLQGVEQVLVVEIAGHFK